MQEEAIIWHGSLNAPSTDNSTLLQDISLKSSPSIWRPPLPKSNLEFLAYINPSLVPLHLLLGPSVHVGTYNDDTQAWFSSILMDEKPLRQHDSVDIEEEASWDDTPLQQSRVGILARPTTLALPRDPGEPRITEVLFFAERSQCQRLQGHERLPTPPTSSQEAPDPSPDSDADSSSVGDSSISVRALLISSDLQVTAPVTPPASGSAFIAPRYTLPESAAQRTKKRLGSMFDEAVERRKLARRSRGQSVSFAAATVSGFERSTVKREEDDEAEDAHDVRVLTARRVGKEPVHSRPGSARGVAHVRKASISSPLIGAASLPSPSLAPPSTLSALEQRNKESVSRIVMAGMRIYGLQASKRSKTAVPGSTGSGVTTCGPDEDAEFKGVYHQTYKGTLFTFRRDIAQAVLAPERVREVVDRLLAIFCLEPP